MVEGRVGKDAVEGVVGGDEGFKSSLQHHSPSTEVGKALHDFIVESLHGLLPGGGEGAHKRDDFLCNDLSVCSWYVVCGWMMWKEVVCEWETLNGDHKNTNITNVGTD